jgi:hypothetical protein
MNQDIKAQWVTALRSGNYAQTDGRLRKISTRDGETEEGFCCLGVLCDLAVKAGVISEPTQATYNFEDSTIIDYQYGEEKEESILPKAVIEWAELDSTSPFVFAPYTDGHGYYKAELTELNDGGTGFAKIANLIEASTEL